MFSNEMNVKYKDITQIQEFKNTIFMGSKYIIDYLNYTEGNGRVWIHTPEWEEVEIIILWSYVNHLSSLGPA